MVDNYIIYTKMLGKGAFGEVYLGLNKQTRSLVAVKTEIKLANKNKILMHEHSILKDINISHLAHSAHTESSDLFYWEDLNKCYMVSPLYGPSLDHMHKLCSEKFTLKTCIMIGVQLLDLISCLHRKGILHRDVKPANILVEYKLPHVKLHLIDFGLSKKCIKDKIHIPFKENVPRVGSLRYMSKHTHRSAESSYRDDIVSIGYLIVYLFVGSLPWKAVAKELTLVEKHQKVLQVKNKISNERLCHKLICNNCTANNPTDACKCSFKEAMCKYFDYSDSLTFGQVPDYAFLTSLIKKCSENHNISLDYKWDWSKFYPES
jgi:serine/threonine protein kinase